jgi:hypothetical protein
VCRRSGLRWSVRADDLRAVAERRSSEVRSTERFAVLVGRHAIASARRVPPRTDGTEGSARVPIGDRANLAAFPAYAALVAPGQEGSRD